MRAVPARRWPQRSRIAKTDSRSALQAMPTCASLQIHPAAAGEQNERALQAEGHR